MRFTLFALLVFLSSSLSFAQIKEFKVKKYKLDNGLTVLLHQDNDLPIYSLHLWYDVGSSDEDPRRTGLAHFFEHLMFKGTTTYQEGVYDKTIERNGGQNNAFTSQDYTGYYVAMPSGTLEDILKLESDRMVNLAITDDKVKREREVVKEERRLRVDNSPIGLAIETVFANAYKDSPYKWPIIGSMKHLQQASLNDFKAFYETYYSPNNAVLVIVGDFSSSKAEKWIKKYFGKLKAKNINRRVESGQLFAEGGKRIRIKKPVESEILAASFPGTSVFQDESYALDLLAMVLAEGKNSRLHKELVDKQKLLISVDQWNFTPTGKGILLFYQSLRPNVSTYKARKAFEEVIQKTSKEGVTADELEAAKKRIQLLSLEQLKTLSGKARGLARNELIFKDYTKMFDAVSKYNAVSLQEVNAAAKKYLDLKKMNTVEVGKK